MERDVMDIVREKEFIELSAAERAELGELCSSEDEFNQVKSMFAGMAAMDWSNPTPKAETKESLDHLFAQKHPKAAPVWYNAPLAVLAPKGKPFYRQPLVQAAAVGLLIFLAYPFVNSNVMNSETNQVAALDEENTSTELKKTEAETEANGNTETSDDKTIELDETATAETRTDVELNKQEFTTIDPSPKVTATVAAAPPASDFKWGADASKLKDDATLASSTVGSGAAKPGSDHPDGIFMGDNTEIFSVPASHEPAVFDLLTSTF